MQGVDARHAAGDRTAQVAADNELMAACRAGDRLALERLLTPHERPLYLLCLGVLHNADEAEDAVQEAFLRALRALPRFRGESTLKTWLHRIALNVCLEWKRSRKPTTGLLEAERRPSTEPQPDQVAIERAVALDALRRLTPQQRAVVLLKDVEGWSGEEIAEAMGWNRKKVENELYRARRALGQWRSETEGARD